MAKRAALVAAALLAALPFARARAENDPCARFEDPLAYNSCLASHGPKAGAVGKSGGSAPEAGSGAGPRSTPPWREHALTRRRGRVHMEFLIR